MFVKLFTSLHEVYFALVKYGYKSNTHKTLLGTSLSIQYYVVVRYFIVNLMILPGIDEFNLRQRLLEK